MCKIKQHLKDFTGYYRWSKDQPVDNEIVEALYRKDEFEAKEGEEFLFTSPCARFHSVAVSNMGFLCITNKRIIFLAGRWQPNIQSSQVDIVSFLDISSLTTFRVEEKNWRFPYKTILIKGRFIEGNDLDGFSYNLNRTERISLSKIQNDFKLFKEAIRNFDLELGDPDLNLE